MMRALLFSLVLLSVYSKSFTQNTEYPFTKDLVVPKGASVPDEYKILFRGVKYGYWNISETQIDYFVNNPHDAEVQMILSLVEYLKEDVLLDEVAITKEQVEQLSKVMTASCEVVNINFKHDGFKSDFLAVGKIDNMQLKFTFCDNTNLTIFTDLPVNGNTNYSKKPQKHFSKIMRIEDGYDISYQRELAKPEVILNELEVKGVLESESERHALEGIYEFFSQTGDDNWVTKKLAIIKAPESIDGDYYLIYLKGDRLDWVEGELKAVIIKTLSPSDFKLSYYLPNKSLVDGSLSFLDNAINIYVGNSSAKFIKVF